MQQLPRTWVRKRTGRPVVTIAFAARQDLRGATASSGTQRFVQAAGNRFTLQALKACNKFSTSLLPSYSKCGSRRPHTEETPQCQMEPTVPYSSLRPSETLSCFTWGLPRRNGCPGRVTDAGSLNLTLNCRPKAADEKPRVTDRGPEGA